MHSVAMLLLDDQCCLLEDVVESSMRSLLAQAAAWAPNRCFLAVALERETVATCALSVVVEQGVGGSPRMLQVALLGLGVGLH
jgi:hypothetical protein